METLTQYSPLSIQGRVPTLHDSRCYRLSRHVQLRPEHDGFVAESLITGHCERLPNAASVRLLLSLMDPAQPGALLAPLDARRASVVRTFLGRCLEGGLITEIADDGTTLTGTEAILPFLDQTYERRTDATRHRARARAEVPYFEENTR